MSLFSRLGLPLRVPRRRALRAAIALVVLCAVAITAIVQRARLQVQRTTEGLQSAARQMTVLTETPSADHHRRAAIAWGYAERMRLGMESPFKLVEAAARDPRLTPDERRTVSWALLARVLRGESHEIDPAALDQLGPWTSGGSVSGERHLELIENAVGSADSPRAGEMAVRLAYLLASVERLVDGSTPLLAAEVAALITDREVARREARTVVRATHGSDPIAAVRDRRTRRAFYTERPVLFAPGPEIESEAIELARSLLDSIRAMRSSNSADSPRVMSPEPDASMNLRPQLFASGGRLPPAAHLAVTVQRYLPLVRARVPNLADALGRSRNPEMLVAAIGPRRLERAQRRVVGRLLLAAAVAMRSAAQEPVWFEGDSTLPPARVASNTGLGAIAFDANVPVSWRPYFLKTLADGIREARRVLPALSLAGVSIRFRMDAPADSALAMHDPRTRTIHLPVASGAGTLIHELAHDLDRQSAKQKGLAGYRSDNTVRMGPDRPAEIFATRVDWFVAGALAMQGRSSGFLSAVQDEVLTGHVLHPERLNSGNPISLVTTLEGATSVAEFAALPRAPTAHGITKWVIERPVERRTAAWFLAEEQQAWEPIRLIGHVVCGEDVVGRPRLVRLAAESRARGWLRRRARATPEENRPAWAQSALLQPPWAVEVAEQKVAALRDHILIQLAASAELPSGLTGHAAELAADARCKPPGN
jgi:hypothetical protein